MRVRIEGGGHCVEVEASSEGATISDLIKMVQTTYQETRNSERTTTGFGGQMVDRTRDESGFAWGMGSGEQPTVTA